MNRATAIKELAQEWETTTRWKTSKRPYSAEDVVRLRGSVQIEHTLARRGANKLPIRVKFVARR